MEVSVPPSEAELKQAQSEMAAMFEAAKKRAKSHLAYFLKGKGLNDSKNVRGDLRAQMVATQG